MTQGTQKRGIQNVPEENFTKGDQETTEWASDLKLQVGQLYDALAKFHSGLTPDFKQYIVVSKVNSVDCGICTELGS